MNELSSHQPEIQLEGAAIEHDPAAGQCFCETCTDWHAWYSQDS